MQAIWLFGYGSLIYKVDFPYLERRRARLDGWARRFWQGSHDHRGTPEAPGRVVTLVPDAASVCVGMAYRVTPDVFAHLDHREKNGYVRETLALSLDDGKTWAHVRKIDGAGGYMQLAQAADATIYLFGSRMGVVAFNEAWLREGKALAP